MRLIVNVRPPVPAILTGLSRFKGRVRSTKEPMEEALDEIIIPAIEENFDTASSPNDGAWEDLSDVRVMRTQLGLYNRPILNMTGQLKRHATMKKYWQFNGQLSKMEMVGPLDPPYWAVQQYGDGNAGLGGKMGPIPARPYIDISEEDVDAIGEKISVWAFGKGVL